VDRSPQASFRKNSDSPNFDISAENAEIHIIDG